MQLNSDHLFVEIYNNLTAQPLIIVSAMQNQTISHGLHTFFFLSLDSDNIQMVQARSRDILDPKSNFFTYCQL